MSDDCLSNVQQRALARACASAGPVTAPPAVRADGRLRPAMHSVRLGVISKEIRRDWRPTQTHPAGELTALSTNQHDPYTEPSGSRGLHPSAPAPPTTKEMVPMTVNAMMPGDQLTSVIPLEGSGR
jgi:hypothetical protein